MTPVAIRKAWKRACKRWSLFQSDFAGTEGSQEGQGKDMAKEKGKGKDKGKDMAKEKGKGKDKGKDKKDKNKDKKDGKYRISLDAQLVLCTVVVP